MIDRRFVWAAGFSFLAAALSLVGLIHGAEVSLSPDDIQAKLALGYALHGARLPRVLAHRASPSARST